MPEDFPNEIADYLKADSGKNIVNTLFDKFRYLILSGKLPPGSVLPNENIMCEKLSVSRSTLREAYTALSVSGFITRSKTGTYINDTNDIVNFAPFSITVESSEIRDLMEFRYMIEVEIAKYAARRATEEDIEKMTDVYNKMYAARYNRKLFSFFHTKFHMLIASASKNKLFVSTMTAAYDSFEKEVNHIAESIEGSKEDFEYAITTHKRILDAIRARDEEKAFEIMKEHIGYANKIVEE